MRIFVFFIITALSIGNLMADEIYLKDKNVLKGKIISITEDRIEYDPEGDIPFAIVRKYRVEKIVYDDGTVDRDLEKRRTNSSNNIEEDETSLHGGSSLFSPGLLKNKIILWGGMHNHLYGYKDERYREYDENGDKKDQGDYIKTSAKNFGFEFFLSDFSKISRDLKIGRAGINFSGYIQDKIPSRKLYPVPLHNIPEETQPDKTDADQYGKWWYNFGFFVGADTKWWGIDGGLTVATTIIKEKYREKLDPNSDPNNPAYDETKGRGLMFDKSKIVPNFFLRLGMENSPHFTFSAYRDDYDPVYGALMGKIIFPVSPYFDFNVGGYFWQTQAAFIEPVIKYSGIFLGLKAGIIINYHEEELKNVGLQDSFFYSCSAGYEWK